MLSVLISTFAALCDDHKPPALHTVRQTDGRHARSIGVTRYAIAACCTIKGLCMDEDFICKQRKLIYRVARLRRLEYFTYLILKGVFATLTVCCWTLVSHVTSGWECAEYCVGRVHVGKHKATVGCLPVCLSVLHVIPKSCGSPVAHCFLETTTYTALRLFGRSRRKVAVLVVQRGQRTFLPFCTRADTLSPAGIVGIKQCRRGSVRPSVCLSDSPSSKTVHFSDNGYYRTLIGSSCWKSNTRVCVAVLAVRRPPKVGHRKWPKHQRQRSRLRNHSPAGCTVDVSASVCRRRVGHIVSLHDVALLLLSARAETDIYVRGRRCGESEDWIYGLIGMPERRADAPGIVVVLSTRPCVSRSLCVCRWISYQLTTFMSIVAYKLATWRRRRFAKCPIYMVSRVRSGIPRSYRVGDMVRITVRVGFWLYVASWYDLSACACVCVGGGKRQRQPKFTAAASTLGDRPSDRPRDDCCLLPQPHPHPNVWVMRPGDVRGRPYATNANNFPRGDNSVNRCSCTRPNTRVP